MYQWGRSNLSEEFRMTHKGKAGYRMLLRWGITIWTWALLAPCRSTARALHELWCSELCWVHVFSWILPPDGTREGPSWTLPTDLTVGNLVQVAPLSSAHGDTGQSSVAGRWRGHEEFWVYKNEQKPRATQASDKTGLCSKIHIGRPADTSWWIHIFLTL